MKCETGGIASQRARLIKAQADMHELKVRQKTGELVEREAMHTRFYTMVRQARDAFKNLPARWSGILAAESDQHKVFLILDKAIHDILLELSDDKSSTS